MVSSDFTNNGAVFCVLFYFFFHSIMFMTFCVVIKLCHCLKKYQSYDGPRSLLRGANLLVNVDVNVIKHVLSYLDDDGGINSALKMIK